MLTGLIIAAGCGAPAAEPAPSPAPAPAPAPAPTPEPPKEEPKPEPATAPTPAPAPTPEPPKEEPKPEPPKEEPKPEPPPPPPGGGDFSIVPKESEARYDIDEDFEGERVTVYGITKKISGSFTVLYADPAAAVMGPIVIEADSFVGYGRHARKTRDNNINLLILHTFKYKTITFTPTALEGLPDHLAVGDNITLSLIGDLTIRDTTKSETVDVTLNVVSEDRLEGTMNVVISRDDYKLIRFALPRDVANIADEVVLTVRFVAVT